MADLPANADVGTDAVFAEGQVYLLNGANSRFYRYSPTSNSWQDLGALPGTGAWYNGPWLVFDGVQALYAYRKVNKKAPYNEMWTYLLGTGTWSVAPKAGSPGAAAASGSAGAWLDGAIYALTGNSTREFWECVPGEPPVWTRLGDIPAAVSTGGDVCANASMLFAFSGNRTNQFWRYVRPPEGPGDGGAGLAQLAEKFSLSVAPNPMRLGTAIRYAVPAATNVSLKLYDITGSLARTISSGPAQPGRYTADLSAKGLARGVYILKLESDAGNLTRKVVIQ